MAGKEQQLVPPPPPEMSLVSTFPPTAAPVDNANPYAEFAQQEEANPYEAFTQTAQAAEPQTTAPIQTAMPAATKPAEKTGAFSVTKAKPQAKQAPEKPPVAWAKPGPYLTKLNGADEKHFQDWVAKNKVPFDASPKADYDMRGFWQAMMTGDPNAKQDSQNQHFPDTWKTPFHKSFSNQSKYATADAPHWQGSDQVGYKLIDKSGKVVADESKGLIDQAAEGIQHQIAGLQQLGGQIGADVQKTIATGDIGGAIAAGLSGLPIGITQFGQDLVNTGVGGLRALGAKDIPAASGADVLRELLAGQTEKFPGFAGAGEFVGGSAIPMAVPLGSVAKGAPVLRALLEGGAAGLAAGTVGEAGHQAAQGGALDIPAAVARGGVPGAALGALAGGVAGAGGKALRGTKKAAPAAATPAPAAPGAPPAAGAPHSQVTLPSGSTVTHTEAMKLLDAEVDPVAKDQIAEAIADAHKRDLLGDTAQLDVKAELAPKAPEPAAAAPPETVAPVQQPGQNLGQNEPSQAPKTTPPAAVDPGQNVGQKPVQKPEEVTVGDYLYTEADVTPEQWTAYKEAKAEYDRHRKNASMTGNAQDQGKHLKGLGMKFSARKREIFENWKPEPAPNTTPEPAPNIPEATPNIQGTEAKGTQVEKPLYQYEKQGAWYHVTDQNGVALSRTKDRKQAERRVESLNAGATIGRGKRTDLETKRDVEAAQQLGIPAGATSYQRAVIERGKPLPDNAPTDIKQVLEDINRLKRLSDHAEAAVTAADVAFQKVTGQPLQIKTRRFGKERESFVSKAFADDLYKTDEFNLEINSDRKPVVDPAIYDGYTKEEIAAEANRLEAEHLKADDAFSKLRTKHKDEIREYMRGAKLPSVNATTPEGTLNVRVTAAAKSTVAAGQENYPVGDVHQDRPIRLGVKGIQKILSGLTPEQLKESWNAASTETNPTAAVAKINPKRKRAGGRSQSGQMRLVSPFKAVAQQPQLSPGGQAATAAIAVGAHQNGKISRLAHTAKTVLGVVTLRRSFDIVHELSPSLHNELWKNVGREAIASRGVKFEPGDEALVQASLKMTPAQILQGANGLSKFSAQQRSFLSMRKLARQESATAVRAEREQMDATYGDQIEYNRDLKTTKEVLVDLESALTGQRTRSGTSEFTDNAQALTGAMYDYIFKWNPSYHALNLLDPIIFGSSRAGLQRVVGAKMLIHSNPKVKEYIHGFNLEGAIEDFRKETRSNFPAGAFDDKSLPERAFSGALRGITKLQSKIPDMPSVRWNNDDMFATGIILHGDKIKYPGGGTKLLADMAEGKLSKNAELDAVIEAIKVNNDVNGSGTFGLDKDPIQRGPLRGLVQFTSQPYRMTRKLKDWADAAARGDADGLKSIMIFGALQIAFSGRGVLPREVEEAWKLADPQSLYVVQDALDNLGNLPSKVPVVGRDLSDKLRWSVLPAITGTQGNIAQQHIMRVLAKVEKKPEEVQKAVLLMALSALVGGGGGTFKKADDERKALIAGKKTEYAFDKPLVELPGQRPIGKRVRTGYGAEQALFNLASPGEDVLTSGFRVNAERQKRLKGTPALKNLTRRPQ